MINKKLYLMNGKEFIYDLYSNLVKNAEKYENITRSKMLDQIIEALDKDFKLINILYTEEKINNLNGFIEGKIDDINIDYFCGFNENNLIDVYEGFVPYIKKAYEFTLDKNYALFKEPYYYAMGLILSFGALKISDFVELFNKEYPLLDAKKVLKSPYVIQYAKIGKKYVALKQVWNSKDYIIDSQNLDFNLNNSKLDFIERGHYLISRNTKNYNKILENIRFEFIFKFNYFIFETICYAGFNNFDGFIDVVFKNIELDENELRMISNFFQSLPDWISKNVSGYLNRRDVDFYYETFIPFIKWYGKRINLPIAENYLNNTISQNDLHEVIKEASKLNFSLVNEYINKTNLSERQNNFLLGLKKSIFGNFIVAKLTNEGALFLYNDVIYLVKGLYTPITSIFYQELPVFTETLILPFEGHIISSGIYNSYNVSVGPNLRKNIKKDLMNKKIIKQFIDA